jgi:hypothetical protein
MIVVTLNKDLIFRNKFIILAGKITTIGQTKGGHNLFGNLQGVRTHQGNIVDEVHTGFVGPNVRQLLQGTEFHTGRIASVPSLQAEVTGAG